MSSSVKSSAHNHETDPSSKPQISNDDRTRKAPRKDRRTPKASPFRRVLEPRASFMEFGCPFCRFFLGFGFWDLFGSWMLDLECLVHEPAPHRLFAQSLSESLGDIRCHRIGRVAPARRRTANPFAAATSSRFASRLRR